VLVPAESELSRVRFPVLYPYDSAAVVAVPVNAKITIPGAAVTVPWEHVASFAPVALSAVAATVQIALPLLS